MSEEIKEKIKAYYLGDDIGEVLDFITNLQVQLQQKENIIKEVKEHLQETINRWKDYEQFYEVVVEDKYILGILDKEVN